MIYVYIYIHVLSTRESCLHIYIRVHKYDTGVWSQTSIDPGSLEVTDAQWLIMTYLYQTLYIMVYIYIHHIIVIKYINGYWLFISSRSWLSLYFPRFVAQAVLSCSGSSPLVSYDFIQENMNNNSSNEHMIN